MKKFYFCFLTLLFPLCLLAQYPSLDTSFNEDGRYISDLYVYDLAVQSDKKIIIIGSTTPYYHTGETKIKRLNPDHGLDETFGTDGEIIVNFGRKILVQSDDKILIGGSSLTDDPKISTLINILRLHPDGDVDLDFGEEGKVFLDNAVEKVEYGDNGEYVLTSGGKNSFTDFSLQPDGKIVVLGTSTFPRNYYDVAGQILEFSTFSTFRLNSDGTLDDSWDNLEFGGPGKVQIPIYHGDEVITGVPFELKIQPDGKIILIGKGYLSLEELSVFAIVRLTQNGFIDETFNDGNTILPPTHHNEGAESIVLQDDNKLIVGGHFWNWFTENDNIDFKIMRLNEDGSPDLSYGENGEVVFPDHAIDSDFPTKIFLLPNQDILVYRFPSHLNKIKSDGTIDENFDPPYGGNVFELQDNDKLLVAGDKIIEQGDQLIVRYVNFEEKDEETIEVEKFTLYNAETDEELFELEDGVEINLQEIKTDEINIRAYTLPEKVGSVKFTLTGTASRNHVENVEAYALYANDGEDYNSWKPQVGDYELKATPFSEKNAKGVEGTTHSITFTIIDEKISELAVQKFMLINAENDEELFEIVEGQEINLEKIGTGEINIRAYTNPEPTGSVKFNLTGTQNYNHIENNAYYALFANLGNDFFSWEADEGDYQLIATPFSEKNAKGTEGSELSVRFSIVRNSNNNQRLSSAFPNPGDDVVNLPASKDKNVKIKIFDLAGKEIIIRKKSYFQDGEFISIDVSELDKKSYIIKIIEQNNVKTYRWIKQ